MPVEKLLQLITIFQQLIPFVREIAKALPKRREKGASPLPPISIPPSLPVPGIPDSDLQLPREDPTAPNIPVVAKYPVVASVDCHLGWVAGGIIDPVTGSDLRNDISEIEQGLSAINWDADFVVWLSPYDKQGNEITRQRLPPGTDLSAGESYGDNYFHVRLVNPDGLDIGEGDVRWSRERDEFVNTLPLAMNIAVASRPYRESLGYGIRLRAVGRRSGRHTLFVYGFVHDREARLVESDELRVFLD